MASKVSVFDALSVIADLDDAMAEGSKSDEERRKLFIQHLQKMDKLNFTAPDFKQGLDWLNVSEPLTWDSTLNGQLVVLDFFTYCCVNCLHILPDLHEMETRNPPGSGVVVIGVHSAKFENEKITANILSAVLRYHITHPVVNDSEATLWQELSVSCWPTLLFVGPSNQLLYTLVGEGHLKQLLEFVKIAKEYYTSTGALKPKSLPIHLEESKIEKSALNFPGKIFYWSDRDWLVISDTGNHRIIVTDRDGVVQEKIGSSVCGFKDGTFQEATFSSPQGIACWRHKMYIADTGNHAIRVLDLSTKKVSTAAGTGSHGNDKEGGKIATDQILASPWDVVLGHSKSMTAESDPDVLYIAMAGTHQIWAYFLEDAQWYKGRSHTKGTCVRFAGSGAEENRNNSYPEKAGFAQPSGLALSTSRNIIYLADSESSSIRSVSLDNGKVSGVVGAEKDPMNLFASGDSDGKDVNAKLQHPLGVALLSPKGPLIVADSYNHKLKTVDLETNLCETLTLEGGRLNEPGGLGVDQDSATIYVTDTNNHAVKVVDFKSKTVTQLPIIFPKEEQQKDSTNSIRKPTQSHDMRPLPDVTISPSDTSMLISIPLEVGPGEHLNVHAPNKYSILPLDSDESPEKSSIISSADSKGKLPAHLNQDRTCDVTIPLNGKEDHHLKRGTYSFQATTHIFLCLDKGDVCLPPRKNNFKLTVHVK